MQHNILLNGLLTNFGQSRIGSRENLLLDSFKQETGCHVCEF